MNPYQEILPHLNNNHFYPKLVKELKTKGEECIGLEVDCPSILLSGRVDKIKSILGEGWNVQGMPNEDFISITKL